MFYITWAVFGSIIEYILDIIIGQKIVTKKRSSTIIIIDTCCEKRKSIAEGITDCLNIVYSFEGVLKAFQSMNRLQNVSI